MKENNRTRAEILSVCTNNKLLKAQQSPRQLRKDSEMNTPDPLAKCS